MFIPFAYPITLSDAEMRRTIELLAGNQDCAGVPEEEFLLNEPVEDCEPVDLYRLACNVLSATH